uniref:Kunitz/Bovine pancreatic trypsin inhibitor domain protein n=1 Tax=Parastrongyloides trichosuri TaxID=131310 RepID=A0A0N5A628_PARTI
MILMYRVIIFFLLTISTILSLQCNPTESIKKVNPEDPYSYLYCNLEGTLTTKMCSPGNIFNTEKAECEVLSKSDDPFLLPQNQAPEDICMGGVPLTRLSAPVVCNPSISSCPDGYVCNIYSRTGTAYCCKNPNFEVEENKDILCPATQVTYFDDNALPKGCLLNKKSSCPFGFSCTLIGGMTTRCCGQSFGCPINSAGLINSLTGGFTGCDINDKNSWPHGFSSSNTYCSTLINQNINTCPYGYACSDSILNSNAVCCPTKENTCNEEVTAGTTCFGNEVSILRFYYDNDDNKCKPFQYFGCNGSSNQFLNLFECENTCVITFANVCNGMAPLMAPNHELVECSDDFPCPDGYTCNGNGNCCPEAQLACQTHVSLGSTCSKYKAEKAWYWDEEHAECKQFLFNGCGGTANRFFSKSSCLDACTKPVGECPSGMNPFRVEGMVQECTLNVATSCPDGHSCVLSSTGIPICCQSVAKCPGVSKPYIIPGSDSFVACTPESNTCPKNYECIESDKVNGFYLCCSERQPKSIPQTRTTLPVRIRNTGNVICPADLQSNGAKCKINVKDSCAKGYTCMGLGLTGVCCKGIPTCKRNLQAVLLAPKQVQLCGKGLTACPKGSACAISSIKNVNICCKTSTFFGNKGSIVPKCKGNKTPFYELGSRTAKVCEIGTKNTCPKDYICQETSDEEYHCCPAPDQCPNKGIAYIINGKALACNLEVNNCPSGYKCEGEHDTAICCKKPFDQSSCPDNKKPFTMAGRPLVCPKGSKTCPNGYSCVAKCTREFNTCPVGYDCDESSVPGKWICCSTGLINKQYEGYCPMGQIPYVGMNSPEPPSCHMTLTPCPTSGAYTCVYSALKQNSYCCAPLEAAVFMAPTKKISPPVESSGNNNFNVDEEIGCPTGSKPFLEFGMPKRCSVLDPCPTDFICKQNRHDASIYQCCSSTIIVKPIIDNNNYYGAESMGFIPNNNMNFMNPSKGQLVLRAGFSSSDVEEMDASKGCPNGFSAIENKCKKMYYLGQRGCEVDEQCSLTTQFAFCNKGYCACPHDKLIHNAKCIDSCPLGFLNIAGRCHDITTVMLMDSVDERNNGTIGGFCLDTVVAEEQCLVKNSFCNEKSITCQCKPGFDLKINFDDLNDKGSCDELEDSKYTKERLNDYLKPQNQEPELFYVMEMRDDEDVTSNSTAKP